MLGDSEQIDLSEDDDKKKKKKKVKSNVSLVYRLNEFYEKKVAENDAFKIRFIPEKNTRSMEELRKKYRKGFVQSAKAGRGACVHCGAVTRSIVLYRSR